MKFGLASSTDRSPQTSAADQVSGWRSVYLLVLLLTAYMFSYADRQILSLLVEPIKRDLDLSDFQMSFLQGWAFSLLYAVMGIPIAKLADRMNRRNIIAAAITIWSLMTAMCGMARSFAGLFLARVGVGVGEAGLSPPAYSLLSDSFSSKRLPLAIAVYLLGVSFGTGGAFLLGGIVVKYVMETPDIALPIIGQVRSWQAAFIIVGLPGLLVALNMLTVREPERRGRLRNHDGEIAVFSFREVLSFMYQRQRMYLPLFLGFAMISVFTFGMLAWYPTFLIRTYGLSPSDAAFAIGGIYMAFGVLGTISGPFVSNWYLRRGHRDAHVRLCSTVAWACGIPAVAGPLMPEAWMALMLFAPYVYIKSLYVGVSGAAVQLVTPNQIRAQVSAINLFSNSIIGMGVGATLIAVFTDFIFRGEHLLRYSLISTAIISSLIAWMLLRASLAPYVEALDEAKSWEDKL